MMSEQETQPTTCRDCHIHWGIPDIIFCPLHAQAEVTAKELAAWQSVFEGYFGPEGRLVEIAEKGVQDLQAELRVALDDGDALFVALDTCCMPWITRRAPCSL